MQKKASEAAIELEMFEEKRVSRVPCEFVSWSECRNRFVIDYPAVECELRCETCGWNPRVMKERIERRFKHELCRKDLHQMQGPDCVAAHAEGQMDAS